MDRLEAGGVGEQGAMPGVAFEPRAVGDDMQVFSRQRLALDLESAVRQVARAAQGELRAVSAGRMERLAAAGVVAAAGERVHVVEGPDDRHVAWDGCEKARV